MADIEASNTSSSSFEGIADISKPEVDVEDEQFLTPPTATGHQRLNPLPTPKSCGIKRLQALKENLSSPALTVPASPLMKRLGFGTGVGVYLLERSPMKTGEIRSPWAIKKMNRMKPTIDSSTYKQRLQYEASILKQLNHQNIVGYRGFSNPHNTQPILAMESASSSLSDLIEARVDSQLTFCPFPAKSIEKVALDIANALDYLHEEKRMIHGDMKSGNALVFGDFETVKLCDFGVAKELRSDGTIDGDSYVGTEVWNPMEVILFQNETPKWPITTKADIYPFGLTIFEMLALQNPHIPTDDEEFESSQSDFEPIILVTKNNSFDESAYEELLAERLGTRPPLPNYDFDSSYNKILETFYCCTEEDPTKRPTAEDVITLISLALN